MKKSKIANLHKRKAENAKLFALTVAYLQTIGRSIKTGKPFSLDDVRQEIESSKQRYGKLNKKWLATHINQTKSWIAQGKIKRLDTYTPSKYSSAPLPQFVGIDNSEAGIFLK